MLECRAEKSRLGAEAFEKRELQIKAASQPVTGSKIP